MHYDFVISLWQAGWDADTKESHVLLGK